MRNLSHFLALGTVAAIVIGCGGSGGGTKAPVVPSLSRVVAGYVFVENNSGIDAGPSIIIAPSSTAPSGYLKPSAGTITIAVDDGTITRGPAQMDFDLATSNEIIATVKSIDNAPSFTISGTGLELAGTAKGDLSATVVSLGAFNTEGKVLGLNVGAPGTYTPGAVASIKILVKDNSVGTNPFKAPADALPSGLISGNTYSIAVAAFDANGIVVTGATPTVTSSQPTVAVNGPSTLLTPVSGTGAAAGALTITATVGTVVESFDSSFGYGTVSTVVLAPAGPTDLLWNIGAAVPATINYTATVKNQYNAPVPATNVAFTGNKIVSNAWNTTSAGAAFSAASVATGNDGVAAVTLNAPASVNGALTGADKLPKGANVLTATVGTVTGTANVNITRPLASVVIAGPSRLDVGTSSATGAFNITGGLDVDNDAVTTPAGTVTWSRTLTAGAGNVGDLDDATAQSTANSTINSSTGVVTAGTNAGQIVVSATVGTTASNNLTVEVYGAPTKVVYTPATTLTGYAGSKVGVSFDLIDNYGHTIPTGEYTGFAKNGTADSMSGASFINQAGRTFDITAGSGTGTFTLTVTGTWTGAAGGSAVIAKTRTTTIAP